MSNQGAVNRPVKATLCRYFASDGQCFFGDSCTFVHAKPSAGNAQPGDKGFTVLPSPSGGFKTDTSNNKYAPSNMVMDHKGLPNNFSALSITGKEASEPSKNILPSSASKGNNTPRNIPGNQAYEFLPTAANHVHQTESIGGTTYFYPEGQNSEPQPAIVFPSYHAYPSTPSHLANLQTVGKQMGNSFSMSTQIRQELLNQHAALLMQLDPDASNIPHDVDNYHSLFPLEPIDSIANQQSRRSFGCITCCYKAVNSKDGLTYVLRRMHALVFVYDYHPGAETVLQRHFPDTANGLPNVKDGAGGTQLQAPSGRKGFPTANASQSRQHFMPERLIWNYVIQISSVLRTIHSMMLSCRVIDPSKILLLSNSRIRINGCGIFDVLDSSSSVAMVQHYQQEDLVAFGKLILALSCYSLHAVNRENIQQSLGFVALKYSNDLNNLIICLLRNPQPSHMKSINDIMPMIGARFYTQLDATQVRCDILQGELAKEMENSRLFRLLCMMASINERPEFNMDPSWAETGDRYLIKLFRDYLFHQVTESGQPWVDMSHIVSSLNKLDSGSPEKICLISRDEQTVLVVSYHDLKTCFDGAFSELFSSTK